MLVPWGLFAQRIGVVEALEEISIPQRSRTHTPQTKLLEFLVSILSGCAYLQDISRGAHPLKKDHVVAQAWGQEAWADYSGVSRTLKACTADTVTEVQEALAEVSGHFIEKEVTLALREQGMLILDGDLTGRPVSNTSTTYPNVAFGWMSDAVHLGYQAALVSMHSSTYGRLWLSVEQHPGNTVSSSEAIAMVRAAEARTGARPRRRTDLLRGRTEQHQLRVESAEQKREHARSRVAERQAAWEQVEQERQAWAQRVQALERVYQAKNRPERPYSQLAQARRKLGVRERRLTRRQQDLDKAQAWLARCQETVDVLREEQRTLEQRLARFTEENRTNSCPVRVVLRLDGGFGISANITLLIELGYEVYTKATNHRTVQALRGQVPSDEAWHRVGKNAEMVVWEKVSLADCPYPVDLALERFHTGKSLKHAVLVHHGPASTAADPEGWFHFYNGRQTIEAGIKEGKNVFQMHHLKVRSPAGLLIQEEFAVFAANFVRWAAAWLLQTVPDAPAPFCQPRANVKQMVRVAANTSARVIWKPEGCLLRFTETSAFAGIELRIGNVYPFQLALPLFKSRVFAPT
jgi:hypothetical protein